MIFPFLILNGKAKQTNLAFLLHIFTDLVALIFSGKDTHISHIFTPMIALSNTTTPCSKKNINKNLFTLYVVRFALFSIRSCSIIGLPYKKHLQKKVLDGLL